MQSGAHPTMEVMCHVSNCKFYKNDYCHASKIEVNPKHINRANTSDDALCSTFIPGK
ncbi:hypothetical protein HNQ80_001931 [Anaerosolibacter carboniphilus]|uniref:DUF1540 domain-containing protein n=1 Tax=Anaerosolibacter carboniphilus TaxID=1417629 RepID=A0A841KV02_9FIRM|nr:DUF1540 domain-containing protein [Anaerosolibacter carboniphilus]MBB6215840.1 hypothetical protein [Anaerosolibacter carboniphilus]